MSVFLFSLFSSPFCFLLHFVSFCFLVCFMKYIRSYNYHSCNNNRLPRSLLRMGTSCSLTWPLLRQTSKHMNVESSTIVF